MSRNDTWRGRDAHQGLAEGLGPWRVGWSGPGRFGVGWVQSQAKTKRPQDRCLRPLRRTIEGHPCPSGSRSGVYEPLIAPVQLSPIE